MIVIIDYGMGNLYSIQSALNYIGAQSCISSDTNIIKSAEKLILPGVGSFKKAIANLKKNNLFEIIKDCAINKEIPILGICLGMQLLCRSSTEDGFTEGFGFIDCPVERFNGDKCINLKIPHVGFNEVKFIAKNKLFHGLDKKADFYFVHSYRVIFIGQPYAVGVCTYGEAFVAAFEKGHIYGTQFHPEKSQTNGLAVLKNFVNI